MKCQFCGIELSEDNMTCSMEWGEPCEDEISELYQSQHEETMLNRMWQEHFEYQRRMGEVD